MSTTNIFQSRRIDASARRAGALGQVGQLRAAESELVGQRLSMCGSTDHRTDCVRPDLIPVGRDSRARRDSGSELKRARGAVVIAGNLGVGGVLDRVAGMTFNCLQYS